LPAGPDPAPAFGFGIAAVDDRLPDRRLHEHGLHELKPSAAQDAGSALALALALLARRHHGRERPLLLVISTAAASEHGLPYGPGLRGLGLDARRLLVVTAARPSDGLWALEEGLRSRAIGGAIGILGDIGMMPARRLVLAAADGATPCLVMTPRGSEGISVAHTRWSIGSLASAPHPLGARLPGNCRVALTLERCRQGPSDLGWILEWCHASHRFRLAPALAPRALAAHTEQCRTG
jgi:protein ImuA